MIPTSLKARLVFIDNIKINHIETLTQPSKDLRLGHSFFFQ